MVEFSTKSVFYFNFYFRHDSITFASLFSIGKVIKEALITNYFDLTEIYIFKDKLSFFMRWLVALIEKSEVRPVPIFSQESSKSSSCLGICRTLRAAWDRHL